MERIVSSAHACSQHFDARNSDAAACAVPDSSSGRTRNSPKFRYDVQEQPRSTRRAKKKTFGYRAGQRLRTSPATTRRTARRRGRRTSPRRRRLARSPASRGASSPSRRGGFSRRIVRPPTRRRSRRRPWRRCACPLSSNPLCIQRRRRARLGPRTPWLLVRAPLARRDAYAAGRRETDFDDRFDPAAAAVSVDRAACVPALRRRAADFCWYYLKPCAGTSVRSTCFARQCAGTAAVEPSTFVA